MASPLLATSFEAFEEGDLHFTDGVPEVILQGLGPSEDPWTTAERFLSEDEGLPEGEVSPVYLEATEAAGAKELKAKEASPGAEVATRQQDERDDELEPLAPDAPLTLLGMNARQPFRPPRSAAGEERAASGGLGGLILGTAARRQFKRPRTAVATPARAGGGCGEGTGWVAMQAHAAPHLPAAGGLGIVAMSARELLVEQREQQQLPQQAAGASNPPHFGTARQALSNQQMDAAPAPLQLMSRPDPPMRPWPAADRATDSAAPGGAPVEQQRSWPGHPGWRNEPQVHRHGSTAPSGLSGQAPDYGQPSDPPPAGWQPAPTWSPPPGWQQPQWHQPQVQWPAATGWQQWQPNQAWPEQDRAVHPLVAACADAAAAMQSRAVAAWPGP